MSYYCEICGHIGGHAYGCPEAPSPEPVTYCTYCDEPLYIGDEAYQAGNDIYCAQCCGKIEIEEPEKDWDFEIDKRRENE